MNSPPLPNWPEVVDAVMHLKPSREALERLEFCISSACVRYRNPGSKHAVTKKEYEKVVRLIGKLIPIVERISTEIHDGEGFRNELASLSYLKRYSDGLASSPQFRDRKPTVIFHYEVLRAWVELGGKLTRTWDEIAGEVKGPLAKYFAVVTRDVTGASLHSLRDAIRQYESIKTDLERFIKEINLPRKPQKTPR